MRTNANLLSYFLAFVLFNWLNSVWNVKHWSVMADGHWTQTTHISFIATRNNIPNSVVRRAQCLCLSAATVSISMTDCILFQNCIRKQKCLWVVAMEVLKPDLVWIDGRCYRVNKTTDLEDVKDVAPSNQYVEEGIGASFAIHNLKPKHIFSSTGISFRYVRRWGRWRRLQYKANRQKSFHNIFSCRSVSHPLTTNDITPT